MILSERLVEDGQARERALALASFIVEAPAGAGKTELLTQRYLRLLAVVDHPEEVLALTFTNKAATEMRDRILRSLETAASGVQPVEPHKQQTFRLAGAALARDGELGWGLLAHPGRLRITTLDALCAGLARQMPYLSRFGSQPAVTDDADAQIGRAHV
jgi:ATP-dependent exoDNAse (exonuclease V) beta subunit